MEILEIIGLIAAAALGACLVWVLIVPGAVVLFKGVRDEAFGNPVVGTIVYVFCWIVFLPFMLTISVVLCVLKIFEKRIEEHERREQQKLRQ